jgi:hypothetical protein
MRKSAVNQTAAFLSNVAYLLETGDVTSAKRLSKSASQATSDVRAFRSLAPLIPHPRQTI